MIQGGDPTGTGKGGTSIWGKKFNDEIKESLKVCNEMYTMSCGSVITRKLLVLTQIQWDSTKHCILNHPSEAEVHTGNSFSLPVLQVFNTHTHI